MQRSDTDNSVLSVSNENPPLNTFSSMSPGLATGIHLKVGDLAHLSSGKATKDLHECRSWFL